MCFEGHIDYTVSSLSAATVHVTKWSSPVPSLEPPAWSTVARGAKLIFRSIPDAVVGVPLGGGVSEVITPPFAWSMVFFGLSQGRVLALSPKVRFIKVYVKEPWGGTNGKRHPTCRKESKKGKMFVFCVTHFRVF